MINKNESDPEIKKLVLYALKCRNVCWPPDHQITEADANYILFRFYHDQDAQPIPLDLEELRQIRQEANRR